MIGLGVRLAVAGGRAAVARLVIIAAAVAIGTGLLLCVVAGVHAVTNQNARYAWLNTGLAENGVTSTPAAPDPVWWRGRYDYFEGQDIGRIDVAETGPRPPVPPGLPALPGPGEYYASPALAALIRSTPADQLADRFAGRLIGTIGKAGLPSPNSMLAVVGTTPAQLAGQRGAHRVSRIETVDPSACRGCQAGTPADGIDLIFGVVAAALLFPLLMFIGTATRLSAARREQRFAALRLIGATPRQISVLSTVESALAATIGMVLGFGIFFLLRPAMAGITFTEEPFYLSDLVLHVRDVVLVGLGIPLAAAVAARLALRRVQISPLGVTRRVTPKPPRAWRLILLGLGIAELTFLISHPPQTTNGQVTWFLAGIFTVMIGLVVAGPWLTMVGARLLARRAGRVAPLIAGRRLADNPNAGFRAVSGLMLALFVTAVATGVITSIAADRGGSAAVPAASNALSQTFDDGAAPHADQIPAGLSSLPGVQGVVLTYANPQFRPEALGPFWPALAACSDLAAHPGFGRCPAGAQVVDVSPSLIGFSMGNKIDPSPLWPADTTPVASLSTLPLSGVVVATDGRDATIERARTMLENAFPPRRGQPSTVSEFQDRLVRQLTQWQKLADVVILVTLPIAGCSLAVAVAGGLSERQRPFSMLRLTGVRLGLLRAVVVLESVVPLLLVSALAIGMGMLTAYLFVRAQLQISLTWPGPGYYLLVALGLAASLGIIASTLPLLRRITGPETARND